MNLICQLRDFFFREEPSVSSYDRLLADLNRACSSLPEGQAFLVTGDGEFTVRLTWKPQQMNPDKRMFSLNGHKKVNTIQVIYVVSFIKVKLKNVMRNG